MGSGRVDLTLLLVVGGIIGMVFLVGVGAIVAVFVAKSQPRKR
jgi:hypothetical protein